MKNKKIVLFERGAEFYFNLGFKYLQKGDLKKALRFIEKAAHIKPEDAFIQFNMAGLLAEMGDIDRSTEILLNIVTNLDPDYSECYFGLGCNFLQLQKIQKSTQYLNAYLEKDPEGDFVEEAEDLLEMLIMIKDANNDIDDEELEKIYKIEEEAVNLLEKKEYEKAAKKFETVVRMLPNAIPARNNLSLAYYYLSEMDKAIELAREVLNYEKENIHANCNLAIFYKKLNLDDWVKKQVKEIKKLNTDNEDYLYKIADTFASLGRHMDAYKIFKRLFTLNSQDPVYAHHAAIGAYNIRRYKESIELWEQVQKLDKGSFLPDYYIDKALKTIENEEEYTTLPYIFQLPKEEVTKRMDRIYKFIILPRENCRQLLDVDKNGEIMELLYFGMDFDRHFLRKLIYKKIKDEDIKEAEGIIRKFMLKPNVENDIKMESVFLLNLLGAKEPYAVNFDGEIKNVTIDPQSFPDKEWKEEWESVKNTAITMMKSCYKGPYKKIVEDIWYGFIKATYPEVPAINKVEVWAAALEYTYCRFYCTEVTQQQIADKYKISKNSLGEKFRIIYSALGKKTQKDNEQ